MALANVSSDFSGYNTIMGDNASVQTVKEEDPLGREAFLTMLVAQLKNQDPLNPMQGSDFSAQLAQFSSLEQLFNVNENLESLQGSFDSNDDGNLLDFIGKEVLSQSDTLSVEDGSVVGGYYNLDETATTVINIYDANGFQVGQITPGQQDAGIHAVEWDGKDLTGEALADGHYEYEVVALGEDGLYRSVETGITGKITGVTFEQGTPYLLMEDRLIAPSSVAKVWG